jgi:hypothetical protein
VLTVFQIEGHFMRVGALFVLLPFKIRAGDHAVLDRALPGRQTS